MAQVQVDGTTDAWGDSTGYFCATPRCVDAGGLGRHSVVRVAAGASHTVCVTSAGAVYTWGRGDAGQLGYNLTVARQSTHGAVAGATAACCGQPTRIDGLWSGSCCRNHEPRRFATAAAGASHTVVRMTLYVCMSLQLAIKVAECRGGG